MSILILLLIISIIICFVKIYDKDATKGSLNAYGSIMILSVTFLGITIMNGLHDNTLNSLCKRGKPTHINGKLYCVSKAHTERFKRDIAKPQYKPTKDAPKNAKRQTNRDYK